MSVDKDLVSVQQARDLVDAAHKAHLEVARYDQSKIDRIGSYVPSCTARGRSFGRHGG